MSNAFDIACPCCGQGGQIDIQAMVWVRLTMNGTDADQSYDGSQEWEPESAFRCGDCGTFGKVSALQP